MIFFKGRSSLKQYNLKKPIKRGYKLWEMADMDGYLYKFKTKVFKIYRNLLVTVYLPNGNVTA